MRPTGGEVIARWREAGEWWTGEPPREVVRASDANGAVRETIEILSPLDIPGAEVEPESPQDRREEYTLRYRKLRDDKVAKACGFVRDFEVRQAAPVRREAALLHAQSGYSFGRSVLMAEEIGAHAAYHGYSCALLADRFSLSGVREFSTTANKVGIQPILGATLELLEGGEIVLVAKNRIGYRSLCRLITECHLGEERGFPLCDWGRLERHSEGLAMLTGGDPGPLNRVFVRRDVEEAGRLLDRFIGLYGREDVFVQIDRAFLPWEISVNRSLLELAENVRVVPVAGGPIAHLEPGSFPAQDVLVCVDSLCTIEEIVGRKPQRAEGQPQVKHRPRRALNAERYMRNVDELCILYSDRQDLIENTLRVAERCERDILPGMSELPKICADETELLRYAVNEGSLFRYRSLGTKLKRRIDFEMERILRLGFSSHFLVAWDMCRWAREQCILFSGRGSVVDSVVAYCLGLTRIDAFEHDLHFDRFLPDDASKRPDIDIDFEAARRNDVRNYLTLKYGVEHVATVAAFGAYRSRGVVRDAGKVLGIPQETLSYLSKRLHGCVTPDRLREAIGSKPELRDSGIPVERLEWVFRLGEMLMDVPTGIRSHSSGVVISRDPIRDVVPVMLSADEDVRIMQWDKRSAKRSFDKFDVLCLRGNDVLSGAQSRIRTQDPDFNVEGLPLDDAESYRTMRGGQLIGIPQSASPAMRQAHVRLQTQNLKDASLVQAGIRPGVGGAVKINELIARRRGKPYSFNHPKLEEIMGITYGIVVFQEQVDRLLQTFGGYSSDEAETIRESIHKKRRDNYVQALQEQVVDRVVGNGYSRELAQEVYELVAVFQGYGFAQGHALAFAEVSVRSVWCQQHYPAEYFASLLDAQPAGYYGPCTLVNEARIRGVRILSPDVNASCLRFTVEDVVAEDDPKIRVPNGGIRIALTQIGGLSIDTRERILRCRESGQFESFFDFAARVRPDRDELERLVLCGAFDSLHPNRRALLWAIPRAIEFAATSACSPSALPLWLPEPELPGGIDDLTIAEKAIRDRIVLGLDVDRHLVAFERERARSKGVMTGAEALRMPHGAKGFVIGNPIRLRFPPTASGKRVMFFDLEDETALLNVTCFDAVYQRDGHTVVCSPYVTLYGMAQVRDDHTAFLAQRAYPYRPRFDGDPVQTAPLPVTTADFLVG